MAIISFASDAVLFIFSKSFPILLETIGLHGCLAIFGVCCMVGILFVTAILKETKGQSLDDVGLDEKARMARAQIRRFSNI